MLSSQEPSRQPRTRGDAAAKKNDKKKNRKVTNANTDRLCLDDNSGFLGRMWYHLSLHNGLYMLDPAEKVALNAAGALFTVLTILYLWSFGKGFIDGFVSGAGPGMGPLQGGQQQLQHHLPALNVLVDQGGNGGGSGGERLLSNVGDPKASNNEAVPLSPASGVVLETAASASEPGGAPGEL